MVKWVKDKLQQILRNEEGMTLIELVAVIVIIGIIAAVAVPITLRTIDNSRVNTAKQDEAIIQNALERYAQDHNGTYPKDTAHGGTGLSVLVTPAQNTNDQSYLNSIPNNPWDSSAPTYTSDGSTYTLQYSGNGHNIQASNNTSPTGN